MNLREFWNEYWADVYRAAPEVNKPKEVWEYTGADIPYNYHESVDGRKCYFFETVHPDGTWEGRIIPVEEFWSK